MTIDEHVKRASRLNPLELRLRDALRKADSVLRSAGYSKNGKLRKDIRAAISDADEVEQQRAKGGLTP